MAATHGLKEEANTLREKLGDNVPELPPAKSQQLMIAATPVMRLHETNWPLLNVSSGPSLPLDASGKFTAGDDAADGDLPSWPSGGDGDDDLNIPEPGGGLEDPFSDGGEAPADTWGNISPALLSYLLFFLFLNCIQTFFF
jgi:hypothetical protein